MVNDQMAIQCVRVLGPVVSSYAPFPSQSIYRLISVYLRSSKPYIDHTFETNELNKQ